jgi:DNA-binding CsgD family transcriptional regulator
VIAKPKQQQSQWQESFVAMLPEIQQRLRRAFRNLDAASRDEAVAEAVVHCLLAYARLHERGRAEVATASTLAFYAARQVRRGRPAAGRMNGKEPLSRYARVKKGFQIERLHNYNARQDRWIDMLVEDKRASVADQVAAKLDVGAWFGTLTQRMKQIARDLAYGFSTSEVAKKHGVTPGRISQLRRALEESWATFQQEAAPVLAR